MNQAFNGRRPPRRQARRIQNGFIEDIVRSRQNTLITVSYPVPKPNQLTLMEIIVLVVSPQTIIQDHRGNRMREQELRIGMRIDAEVSTRTTFSNPPQAQAYQIIVRNQRQEYRVTQGRIINIDERNQMILVGDMSNPSSMVQFVITPDTVIRNRRGGLLVFRDLRVGMNVRIEHATFQTMSLPPQTTAYVVEIR